MALTVKIRADASHFKKTIAGVEMQASGLTGVMAKLGGSIPVFGAALSAAAAGAVALGAGLAFIQDSSGKAAGMESLTSQFEVLTGSASKAASLIKTFRDEAVKSPLSVQDYSTAARGFMSYGVEAEKVLPILKMIGDVSMGNAERFGLLSYAMAQVASNTTLKGDDLRQLVEQGFNPLAVIADKTGRSMMDLRKDMEKGLITYSMVESALKELTSEGGRFYGAIEKGASTTEGKIAKLSDAVLGLKVAFGTGFNEGLKSALDAANGTLPKLESVFGEMGTRLGQAIKRAVEGDITPFISIGILIGEAVKEGFLDVTGNMLVEGVRSFLSQGSESLSEYERMLMNQQINNLIGPKRSNAKRIEDLKEAIEPAASAARKATGPDSWAEELKRNRELTEKLVQQGKTTNEELRKAFSGKSSTLVFSR